VPDTTTILNPLATSSSNAKQRRNSRRERRGSRGRSKKRETRQQHRSQTRRRPKPRNDNQSLPRHPRRTTTQILAHHTRPSNLRPTPIRNGPNKTNLRHTIVKAPKQTNCKGAFTLPINHKPHTTQDSPHHTPTEHHHQTGQQPPVPAYPRSQKAHNINKNVRGCRHKQFERPVVQSDSGRVSNVFCPIVEARSATLLRVGCSDRNKTFT
jgi:hypothetical protein